MMKTAKMRQPHWLYIHNFYKYVSIKFVKMFSTIRTLSITYAANQQQRTEIRTADVVNWTAELELTLWMCGNQFGWIMSRCVCRCLFVFFLFVASSIDISVFFFVWWASFFWFIYGSAKQIVIQKCNKKYIWQSIINMLWANMSLMGCFSIIFFCVICNVFCYVSRK